MTTNKTKKLLASVLLFVCLVVAQSRAQHQGQPRVHHLIVNDANLIETSRGYAITAPALTQNNWKAVTVNGDQVQVTAPDCRRSTMSMQELMSNPDQRNLLMSARQMLGSAESDQRQMTPQIYRSGSARYYSPGDKQKTTMCFGRNIGMSSIELHGLSMTKYDDQNMSIAKSNASPNGISRVFITGDVVTFISDDGLLTMKPQNCLSQDERQLVQHLKSVVQQAEQELQMHMRRMNRRLRSNMRQMHQNMNDMRQMHQNMNNMHPLHALPISNGQMLDDGANLMLQQQRGQSMSGGLFIPPTPMIPQIQQMPDFANGAFTQNNGFAAVGPPHAGPFWPNFPF